MGRNHGGCHAFMSPPDSPDSVLLPPDHPCTLNPRVWRTPAPIQTQCARRGHVGPRESSVAAAPGVEGMRRGRRRGAKGNGEVHHCHPR